MHSSNTKKAIIINVFFIIILSFLFWLGSRYPQLNEKAMMGGDIPLTGISFDVVREVGENDSAAKQVLYHTINWIDTNKKGMMFGLLIGASFMVLFNLLKDRVPTNRWYSTILGLFIGAPLGVCVNCAAPIAKGMRDGGSRAETALATMISSPTMNFIVLTMLFSLLPSYMAITKIITTLLFILFVIPVLTRFFPSKPSCSETMDLPTSCEYGKDTSIPFFLDIPNSWVRIIYWFFRSYIRSLWFIFRTAVPLMILAGFLGNVLITYLPFDEVVKYVVQAEESRSSIVIITLFLTFIGAFLPVPMTFDVIIAVILYTSGLPPKYTMVLLFTLGSYSVYSFFITQKTFSKKLALAIFVSIGGFGIFNGIIGHYYDKHHVQKFASNILSTLEKEKYSPTVLRHQAYRNSSKLDTSAKKAYVPIKYKILHNENAYQVEQIAYASNDEEHNKRSMPFKVLDSTSLGIDIPYQFTAQHILEPLARGGSIACADVNNDNWEDILIVSNFKLNLYLNLQGEGFSAENVRTTDSLKLNNAALADLNHDGWVDIVFSTYYQGIYVSYSDKGIFDPESIIKLVDLPYSLIDALGVGDVNQDGLLDIVLGASSYGGNFRSDAEILLAKNLILLNNGEGKFKAHAFNGKSGETLSTLIADINRDGFPDIAFGNDFYIPDYFYLGDGTHNYPMDFSTNFVGAQTRTTMSISIADINNDLSYEIFQAQSGFIRNIRKVNDVLNETPGILSRHTDLLHKVLSKKQHIRSAYLKNDFLECAREKDWDCIYTVLLRKAMFLRDEGENYEDLLKLIPDDWWAFHKVYPPYDFHTQNVQIFNSKYEAEHPNTIFEHPVLLKKNEAAPLQDVSEQYGIIDTGWAWNAQFADLDNDEWQDLLIANGFLAIRSFDSNLFYKNLGGESFVDATEEFGFTNLLPTGAYSYLDYDHDGDLDVFLLPQVGPLFIYENQNLQNNNSIMIEIRDLNNDNRYAIGAEIIISYQDGKQQTRQILASGGFKSMNALVSHFGLANNKSITGIEINLPTGKSISINETLPANHRYRITLK